MKLQNKGIMVKKSWAQNALVFGLLSKDNALSLLNCMLSIIFGSPHALLVLHYKFLILLCCIYCQKTFLLRLFLFHEIFNYNCCL